MPRPRWKPQPWQVDLVREHFADSRTQDVADALGVAYNQIVRLASKLGLRKSEAFLNGAQSGRMQVGGSIATTRFTKGMTPWNKGQKYEAGGRSPQTRFKPGERHGFAAQRWVPIGSYRINGDGILDRKITDEGRGPRDWEGVHRLVWKEQVGPIPRGHIVIFRPGMRTTVLEEITPARLECISRAENARRNHPATRSPELARLVQLKGAITRQVNRIAREAEERAQ